MQLRIRSSWWTGRLVAWLLVLAMVVMATVAVIMYSAYQRAAAALVVERDRQVTVLSAARLREELSNYADILSALARTPELYGQDGEQQRAVLQQAGFRLATFDGGTLLLDNLGVIRATEPDRPGLIGQDWSDHTFFQQLIASAGASANVAISDGLESPSPITSPSDAARAGGSAGDSGEANGSMMVVVSVPLINDKGQFAGALAGMFGLGEPTVSSFYASIVRLRIGQSGTTYVVDGNSRILYDSSYSQVGKTFDLATLPASPGTDATPVSAGTTGAGRARDTDGHDIVAAYAPVPGTAWTLVTEDDWATLTAGTRRYARVLLAMLVVGPLLPTVGLVLWARQRHGETLEQEARRQERQLAGLVRRTLLPQYVPLLPGYELAVYHRPAGAAAGDFYDYLLLPDGQLMLTVGDVAEGSVQAALVTATIRAALRGAARLMLSPAGALAHGNDLLCPELHQGQSVTCLYALLQPETGRLAFANAGQPIAYYHGNGSSGDLLPAGKPLGLAPAATYEQGEIAIKPGECLLLGSGGVLQTRNGRGEVFGLARLKALLEQETRCGQALVDALQAALEAFARGETTAGGGGDPRYFENSTDARRGPQSAAGPSTDPRLREDDGSGETNTGGKWLLEDDVTLVALARSAESEAA